VRGSVWQVSPIIDPQTRQGEARIALPYTTAIRPGGFAGVAITSGAMDAPLLPESAVLNDGNASYVYVVRRDGVVERRPVTVSTVTDKGVVIASGLAGNEQVVLSAGAFINPGEKVVPVRAAGR
jgi:multidrug efflux pump subunit AcrA (membrane-fusion protein)